MPRREVPPLVIGETDCPACGAVLSLNVNRNGSVYVYCREKLPDHTLCFYRATFGKTKSRELLNGYMQSAMALPQVQPQTTEETPPHDEPENVTEPTETVRTHAFERNEITGRVEPARKSFLGSILSSDW